MTDHRPPSPRPSRNRGLRRARTATIWLAGGSIVGTAAFANLASHTTLAASATKEATTTTTTVPATTATTAGTTTSSTTIA